LGATKATVTSATNSQLTVTVSSCASYQPISVTVNGLTAYSSTSFAPTHPAGNQVFNAAAFAARIDSTTGLGPYSTAVGDLDGDGKPDMVTANRSANTLSVLKNISANGSIAFSPKLDLSSANAPTTVAIADLNADGKPDIAVTNQGSLNISVFINNTTGATPTFAARQDFAANSGVQGLAISDIDGDGRPDIGVSNFSTNNLSVFRNTTVGGVLSFATKVDFTTGNGPYSITAADLDNDGKADLATANQGSNTISVFKNNSSSGSISFAAKADFASGSLPRGIASGDLDADGKADLATNNYSSNSISVFRNTTSGGTFSFARTDSVSGNPLSQSQHISMSDLNGDGKPELVVANGFNNSLAIFRNTCTPGIIAFGARVNYATASDPYNIVINDLDGDGKAELCAAIYGQNKLSVFRGVAAPSVVNFTPATGPVGTVVTVTGYNFKANLTDNIVLFGGVKANVTAATNTSLTVTVPIGATYQPLSVTADKLIGFAKAPFVVNFTGGDTIVANSFAAKKVVSANLTAQSVTISDLDSDGKEDLLVGFAQPGFAAFRNTSIIGNLSFGSQMTVPGGNATVAIVAADLNGDGKPDPMYVDGQGSSVMVNRNTSTTGSISFASVAGPVEVTAAPIYIATADLNLDGTADIIASSNTSVAFVTNTSYNGTMSFGAKQNLLITNSYSKNPLAVVDIDGDGKPDIITGNSYRRNISSNHIITLDAETSYDNTLYVSGLAIGDLDGDGKPDIAALSDTGKTLTLYLNTSSGSTISFVKQTIYITGTGPAKIAITDLNGDGKPDIAVTDLSYDVVSVFTNKSVAGSLVFIPKVDYATAIFTRGIAIGDLDGDGKPELIASNEQPNSVSILRYELATALPAVPTIGSFSPASGPVGTLITITGTNFNSTSSDNIVYFGSVKATVTAASNTSLTVVAPAGASYQPLTVTTGGYTAYASKPFNFIFASNPTAFNASSFDSYLPFGTGDYPKAVAAGDLNNDGKPDMAVVNKDGHTLSIYRNTSNSNGVWFDPKVDYNTGYTMPTHCSMADIDSDGKLDVIITQTTENETENSLVVYRNITSTGSISFAAPVSFTTMNYSVTTNPVFVAAADLDGDGRTDVALLNNNTAEVLCYRNTGSIGNISFAAPVAYSTFTTGKGLVIRDFDGNGKPDLAVILPGASAGLRLFSNTSNVGSISFSAGQPFQTADQYSEAIAAADITGDGKPDLVTTHSSVAISEYTNNSMRGTHLLSPFESKGSNAFSRAIAVDDLNGDGKPDAVIYDLFYGGVSVFRNNYPVDTAGLATAVRYMTGSNPVSPSSITIADFDADGKPDIAVTNISPKTVAILRNRAGEPNRVDLCPPTASISVVSNLNGAAYQWQESVDSVNFTSISDNANFSGTGSGTLNLQNIPSSWYGRTYRCVVNGQNSESFVIRFVNNWTGAVNNAWENAGNWSCAAVPDINTDVVIATGTINLNSSTTIRSIKVLPGANLTIGAGVLLTVLH
jgi:hypothetical protein